MRIFHHLVDFQWKMSVEYIVRRHRKWSQHGSHSDDGRYPVQFEMHEKYHIDLWILIKSVVLDLNKFSGVDKKGINGEVDSEHFGRSGGMRFVEENEEKRTNIPKIGPPLYWTTLKSLLRHWSWLDCGQDIVKVNKSGPINFEWKQWWKIDWSENGQMERLVNLRHRREQYTMRGKNSSMEIKDLQIEGNYYKDRKSNFVFNFVREFGCWGGNSVLGKSESVCHLSKYRSFVLRFSDFIKTLAKVFFSCPKSK